MVWSGHMSEWANVSYVGTQDFPVASTITSSGTTLSLSGLVSSPGDLALAVFLQMIAVTGAVTFTTPGGFTRLKDNSADNLGLHFDLEYQINPSQRALIPTMTSSTATNPGAAGALLLLKAATSALDMTSDLGSAGATFKLNTADLRLVQGGHLLLEDGSGGYLLEDGSGYYLLDNYTPQLGDPAAITNPTWSGRVVSVERIDILDARTNYRDIAITAINSTAAPGGIAPGDFSDVAGGGYYLLEDGSGHLLLEDGSGGYLLEGTAFTYRRLSVKTSQNQDGTVTTYGSLQTFEGGFAPGQAFLLTSQNLGYSAQQFTITNVIVQFLYQA